MYNLYPLTKISAIIQAKSQGNPEREVSVLLTDSRTLTTPSETLFIALSSTRNDGHNYIDELYKKGVRAFVVNTLYKEAENYPEATFLVVKEPLKALQRLAGEHRLTYNHPLIGITGSNGKTVVKEWLYQLLQHRYHITRSPRSYNSQIGVPLSLWQLHNDTNLAIIEVGISQRGEMARLEKIVQPTIGIITNIGAAHQEGFGSLQEKCNEKLTLFQGADIIIYNGDDALISAYANETLMGKNEIAWSRIDSSAPLFIVGTRQMDDQTEITYSYLRYAQQSITIPFTDEASIENAIHCLATLLYLHVEPHVIAHEMAQLEPIAMRMEVKEGRNGSILINDSYNNDLYSLQIALDFQQSRAQNTSKNKRIILSDILQSGLPPASLYRKVANLLEQKGVTRIVGIGSEISSRAAYFKGDCHFFATTEEFEASGLADSFTQEVILIKGARTFHFERITELLQLKQHETVLEVNLDAIVHNLNYYRSLIPPKTHVMAMVKAFGYGVGAYELAKTLQENGCNYLAVAVVDEGSDLRKAGITIPIVVMNPESNSFRTLIEYNLEPEIYSLPLLKSFAREVDLLGITYYPVHIKIDTGMHRLGFEADEIEELCNYLSRCSAVRVKSVFSHLASADVPAQDAFTHEQITRYQLAVKRITAITPTPIIRHLLNTAGISRFGEYAMEMVRLGIGLYGISPLTERLPLQVTSTLKTTILQIREVNERETVGYGRRGVIEQPSRIAAIPIGYADGINRHLGNRKGGVIVNGFFAPFVGNICMDVSMIDVTGIECKAGDSVEIFGEQQRVETIAEWLDTIPYEIITQISSRVKRIYAKE